MRVRLTGRWILALILVALCACDPAGVQHTPASFGPAASYSELAYHYAPIIHQGAASDQDYITAADFDGDWTGSNNWENQLTGDLSAYVYYSVIETETHWYLFYALFHPRDTTKKPCEESDGCHENDLESLQVIVTKDGTPFGHPIALETLAHSHIMLYTLDHSVKRGMLRARGGAKIEDGHPVVWVETYGHGIHGDRIGLHPSQVIYHVSDTAEEPESIEDEFVPYLLAPIYDTLWQHQAEVGPGQAFDHPFDYRGHSLPAAFDGEDYGIDKANTPWGYDQETGDELQRGDFFLDPAWAFSHHATVAGDLALEYIHNPFLEELDLIEP